MKETVQHTYSSSTKRIAKNTLMLYFRQILIMLVSLYTVRVVLATLGAEDYGIYNVVAGVVTMFSFLSGSMATASQRYFSFALGQNDEKLLKETFGVTLTVYLLFVIVVFILAETVGVWFVKNKLVIPDERLESAICIFHFSIITFLVTILTTPYMAAIIAHEEMNIYAYISILEVILKLLMVFILKFLSYDKLILYGLLLLIVAVINTSVYRIICMKKFSECKSSVIWKGQGIKSISSFIGWNFFGSFATAVKTQGYSIFINIYFGPVVNAAQGIATQVRGVILNFSQNFSLAVRPQIIKMYAAEDFEKLQPFLIFSCKITYYLMLLMIVPIYDRLAVLLGFWLNEIPEYTIRFIQLLLIESLVESISSPMVSLNQATGKIALYQFLIGIAVILNLPFTYIILKMGYPPYSIYIGGILFIGIVVLTRLFFLKKIATFSIKRFLRKLIFPALVLTFVSFLICKLIYFPTEKIPFVLLEICIKILIILIFIYVIGLDKQQKEQVLVKIKSRRGR